MLELKDISCYIRETTDIMAVVTGMEVIVCDTRSNVLGDSDYERTKDTDRRSDVRQLSDHAIVRRAIEQKKIFVYKDSKRENPSCKTCVNSDICEICSIIAYPIIDEGNVIGGIGLYGVMSTSKVLIRDRQDILLEFVERISEMIIGKAREKQESINLRATNERLRLLIGSLDDALISFDEDRRITSANRKFYRVFGLEKDVFRDVSAVLDFLDSKTLSAFLEVCLEKRVPDKSIFRLKNMDFTVSFKPVIIENDYKGGLLYFKKNSELYAEAGNIKNDYSNVTFEDITGSSPMFERIKESARHFAKSPSTIYIQGKSGTGKEMFARAIHNESLVSRGPFVVVNCAAIPDNLLESELFGHKEGSFTGSMKGGKTGKFVAADKGTLFLDEIGEMPLFLQLKLLRAIQDRKVQPVGSNQTIPVNIRIIAATNRDLEEMVSKGQFREDLYYRLNVIPITLPSLKERREDIPQLMKVFLDKYNGILDKNIIGFDLEAQELLCNYEWPGNIRELQNVIEYAANDCNGKYITAENLPKKDYILSSIGSSIELMSLREMEEKLIKEAFRRYGNSAEGKEKAARALGIGRATFYRKLKELV